MSVGKLNLDITVEECSSCKNLVIRDDSHYLDTPENPTVTISLPGYSTAKVLSFDYSKINIYNSYTLGLSSSAQTTDLIDLPDGVYTITYAICPYDELNVKVYHLRACLAWCRFDKAVKALFDSCYNVDQNLSKKLQHIEWLLKGASVFAGDCEVQKAVDMYRLATDLLEEIECQLEI